MITVYRIHCNITNRDYIGVTNNLKRRMIEHRNSKSNYILVNAIKKYGWDNFTVYVIDSALTWEEAETKERYYIAALHTFMPDGMNMTEGGNIIRLTDSAVEKNRIAHTGKRYSAETNKKKGTPGNKFGVGNKNWLGKRHTEETKQKNREAHLGKPGPNLGKKMSEETKQKLRASRKAQGAPWVKGLIRSEESKQKNREAHLGKKASEETKIKMKEVHKKQPRLNGRYVKAI